MGEARTRILNTALDLGGALLYYDRKEDEELPVGAIEQAVIDGVVSVDEIVGELRRAIDVSVKARRRDG